MTTSFKHSGDMGDIIYSMPTMRALGGGKLYLSRVPWTRVLMGEKTLQFLQRLLEAQVYISHVQLWFGQPVCYNMDVFRRVWEESATAAKNGGPTIYGVSLAEWNSRAWGFPNEILNQAWLKVHEPIMEQPVVVHRNNRYLNPEFPWQRIADRYKNQMVFVGEAYEHDLFCKQFGAIPYRGVADAYEMAQVIAGSKLFIGNQSLPNAIAEGLKKPKITEAFMVDPNCMFERPDLQTIFTKNVWLPDV